MLVLLSVELEESYFCDFIKVVYFCVFSLFVIIGTSSVTASCNLRNSDLSDLRKGSQRGRGNITAEKCWSSIMCCFALFPVSYVITKFNFHCIFVRI